MMTYSTKGSGQGESVDKVQEAYKIVQEKNVPSSDMMLLNSTQNKCNIANRISNCPGTTFPTK